MNVYDFDNTILKGDSTARFVVFCYMKNPRLITTIPKQLANAFMYLIKRRDTQEFKRRLFSFFALLPDIDHTVAAFWERDIVRVKAFYLESHKNDDVVITASPEFLVRPACDRLSIYYVLGSPVDKKTGAFSGLNCRGEEKLRRFCERFPEGEIDDFYSDSKSDAPLAGIAKRAFLVKGDKVSPWNT